MSESAQINHDRSHCIIDQTLQLLRLRLCVGPAYRKDIKICTKLKQTYLATKNMSVPVQVDDNDKNTSLSSAHAAHLTSAPRRDEQHTRTFEHGERKQQHIQRKPQTETGHQLVIASDGSDRPAHIFICNKQARFKAKSKCDRPKTTYSMGIKHSTSYQS
jgi:hypothetical protein